MSPDHRPVSYRWARRIAVGLVGGTVLLFGIALLVLPGPAFVVIPVASRSSGSSSPGRGRGCARLKERSGDLVNYFRTGGK